MIWWKRAVLVWLAVILVPGADALEFGPDIAEAGLRGIAVHPLVLAPYSGHPIDGRRPYYDSVAQQIRTAIADIRRTDDNALIFATIWHGHGQIRWGEWSAKPSKLPPR